MESDADRDSAVSIIYVSGRKIYLVNAAELATLSKATIEIAGATPDIQDTAAAGDAGNIYKVWRKSTAPSAHQKRIAVAISREELRRRKGH